MPKHGESFLSRVLDDGNTMAIREFGVEKDDFATEVEQNVFDFVTDYSRKNKGDTPDYRTVIENDPDFYYREGVTDSYKYLVGEIKSQAAKRRVADLFAGNPDKRGRQTKPSVEELINDNDGNEAIEKLVGDLEKISSETGVRNKVGTDLKRDTKKIREEYQRRKDGDSFKVWESFIPTINKATGGYSSSNMYVLYGKSGRGKSVFALMEALHLARQGATVLIWSLEMPWYELYVRLFTYYSRLVGNVATATIEGVNMDIGFNSSQLRNGNLDGEFEEKFYEFLEEVNDLLKGNIVVRGVDDDDFEERTVSSLESDILHTKADVAVVDPFYYMDYEANTSKKTGGDAENTSKALRRLAGKTRTVIFPITQADETDEKADEIGNRELEVPQRKDVKKTKQLLEDAALLIGIDTNYLDGRGLVGLNKGRDGGEGTEAEVIYLPQYGIIEELSFEMSVF